MKFHIHINILSCYWNNTINILFSYAVHVVGIVIFYSCIELRYRVVRQACDACDWNSPQQLFYSSF